MMSKPEMTKSIWQNLFITFICISVLLFILFTAGCMSSTQENFEYKVLTLQDVETEMYSMLTKDGAAETIKGEPGKLKITNIEVAKSEHIMPRILNKFGKEGWQLVGINPSQLYMFQRDGKAKKKQSWEYKVITLKELDTMIFTRLVDDGAAEAIKDQPGKFKILNVEQAKSQAIMPVVLGELGKEGWMLSAINKSQLYIFRRPGEGSVDADPEHLAAVSDENEVVDTAEKKSSSKDEKK